MGSVLEVMEMSVSASGKRRKNMWRSSLSGRFGQLLQRLRRLLWSVERRVVNAVLGRRTKLPVRVQGHTFYCSPDEQDFRAKVLTRERDPELLGVIREIVQKGDVCLDLGAHAGYFTLVMAEQVGASGRVVAFEANPATVPFLEANVGENNYSDRVIIVPNAVGTGGRTVNLYRRWCGVGGVSRYKRENKHAEKETVEVEEVSVDQTMNELPDLAGRVTLIKIDIEGAEIDAIGGMGELFRKNRSAKLITEFHPELLMAANRQASEFVDSLRWAGFKRFYDLNNGRKEILEPEIWFDKKMEQRRAADILCY